MVSMSGQSTEGSWDTGWCNSRWLYRSRIVFSNLHQGTLLNLHLLIHWLLESNLHAVLVIFVSLNVCGLLVGITLMMVWLCMHILSRNIYLSFALYPRTLLSTTSCFVLDLRADWGTFNWSFNGINLEILPLFLL